MKKANIFILFLVIWASGFMSNSAASSILDKIDSLGFTSVSTANGVEEQVETIPIKKFNGAFFNEYYEVDNLVKGNIKLNSVQVHKIHKEHLYLGKNKCKLTYFMNEKNVNIQTALKITPLHICIWAGNIDAVKKLLDLGANIYQTTKNGWSAVHFATASSQIDMLKYLMKKNIKFENKEAITQLMYMGAIQDGWRGIVGFWHKRGGDMTSQKYPMLAADVYRFTKKLKHLDPLNSKHLFFGTDVECSLGVDFFILHGAPINAMNEDIFINKSALHIAADAYSFYGGNKCYYQMIKKLIEKGANINLKDEHGNTPLHYAVQHISPNMVDIVRLLIESGANVKSQNNDGQTPLHFVARGDTGTGVEHPITRNVSLEVAKLLLSRGASARALNKFSRHKNCSTFLKCREFYRVDKEKYGSWPIHMALLEGHANMVKFLWPFTYKNSISDMEKQVLLHLLSQTRGHSGNYEDLETFIISKLYSFVNIKKRISRRGIFKLCEAIKHNDLNKMIFTLKNNFYLTSARAFDLPCKIRVIESDESYIRRPQYTPLYYAARLKRIQEASILLKLGANPNSQNYDKHKIYNKSDEVTPLHIAVQNNDVRMVQLLLKNGADIDLQMSSEGLTPLHIAAASGHLGMTRFLVSQGANINPINIKYKKLKFKNETLSTVMRSAVEGRNTDVVRFLYYKGGSILARWSQKEQLKKWWGWAVEETETPLELAKRIQNKQIEFFLTSQCLKICPRAECCLNKGDVKK